MACNAGHLICCEKTSPSRWQPSSSLLSKLDCDVLTRAILTQIGLAAGSADASDRLDDQDGPLWQFPRADPLDCDVGLDATGQTRGRTEQTDAGREDILEQLHDTAFWLAIGQIIWINILLSGDNAVVIAMACRSLSEKQRMWGMVLGAGVAVLLRIIFTGIVTTLMNMPYLKAAGAVALLYIAIDLIKPKSEDEDDAVAGADTLFRAMMTIAVADVVMSLDNVVAIAAVAKGSWLLLLIGLGVSIPMIVAGSAIIMAMLDRFPLLVWAGAALLGWIAGDLFLNDVGIMGQIGTDVAHRYEMVSAIAGAVFVVGVGLWLNFGRRKPEMADQHSK